MSDDEKTAQRELWATTDPVAKAQAKLAAAERRRHEKDANVMLKHEPEASLRKKLQNEAMLEEANVTQLEAKVATSRREQARLGPAPVSCCARNIRCAWRRRKSRPAWPRRVLTWSEQMQLKGRRGTHTGASSRSAQHMPTHC